MATKKSKTKKGRKNVGVPLTPPEYSALKKHAGKDGRSMGEQARFILQPILTGEQS